MSQTPLEMLADRASEAHCKIQQDFEHINPVVGLNRGMRKVGIAADAMTIDCLKSGKRIIIILHDDEPESVQYQFSFKAQDPDEQFQQITFNKLTAAKIYQWISEYFA